MGLGSTPTSSTSFDRMQQDKRYAPANEVPDEVLSAMGSDEIFSPGFSIRGQALDGRASYLVRENHKISLPWKKEKEKKGAFLDETGICMIGRWSRAKLYVREMKWIFFVWCWIFGEYVFSPSTVRIEALTYTLKHERPCRLFRRLYIFVDVTTYKQLSLLLPSKDPR